MRLLLLASLLCSSLGSSAQAADLTVFAASSLTGAFTEIGRDFDRRSGGRTTFNFAGSQVLRTQLEQGARADVLASANAAQYEPLVRAGQIEKGVTFARNRLTVITPAGATRVRTLADLARPGTRLVVAAAGVPAGEATRAVLERLGQSGRYGPEFTARVRTNVVSQEPNVRQVALKVQLGQADAAFVYRSDVTPELRGAVRVISLPDAVNPPLAYPIGVASSVVGGRNEAQARAFIAYVRSPAGQAVLRKWGFLNP